MVRQDKQSGDKGSVVVLVALAMTALLAFSAVVVDLGVLYVKHTELQNALDAAALAGVQELPQNPALAEQVAREYAAQNGVADLSVSFAYNNSEINLSAHETVPTYFANIWDISAETISATSKAMMVPPESLTGIVPLSVEDQEFVYGVQYTLKSASHSGQGQGGYSGWFGALALTGPGARDYETDLTYGYRGTIELGQILDLEHGNISGPTKRAVDARINGDTRIPRNTFDNYDRNAPEIVYVPVVEILSHPSESLHQVRVTGFAAFFLEDSSGNGNESIITGRFLQMILPNSKDKGSTAGLQAREQQIRQGGASNDYGLYAPKLVQ